MTLETKKIIIIFFSVFIFTSPIFLYFLFIIFNKKKLNNNVKIKYNKLDNNIEIL